MSMTEEMKGGYLEGLATERRGYEARLVVVTEALQEVGDDPTSPEGKVRRQELLNQQGMLEERLKQVDEEARRVKGLKARRG